MMTGKNIGDLLNTAHLTWGSFAGVQPANGQREQTTGCERTTVSAIVGTVTDYVPHHMWFQYFASTANPTHARPTLPRRSATARRRTAERLTPPITPMT